MFKMMWSKSVLFPLDIFSAERVSLKRASEAANLIYVYGENLSRTTVYRSALWSCAIGNAR